jgi:hypothetical protein
VDGGLQYSEKRNDWALFMHCAGFAFQSYNDRRFVAGQNVTLRFYVPADNVLAVAATGRDGSGGTVTETLIQDARFFPDASPLDAAGDPGKPTGYGWRADGSGCILKRMTNIDQTPKEFDTASYSLDVCCERSPSATPRVTRFPGRLPTSWTPRPGPTRSGSESTIPRLEMKRSTFACCPQAHPCRGCPLRSHPRHPTRSRLPLARERTAIIRRAEPRRGPAARDPISGRSGAGGGARPG